jgi:hypothetical protein
MYVPGSLCVLSRLSVNVSGTYSRNGMHPSPMIGRMFQDRQGGLHSSKGGDFVTMRATCAEHWYTGTLDFECLETRGN